MFHDISIINFYDVKSSKYRKKQVIKNIFSYSWNIGTENHSPTLFVTGFYG